MSLPEIKFCPGTLAPGHDTYSRTCLKRMFDGRRVSHILPYDSPATHPDAGRLFQENCRRMSISGVQEKFSMLLESNQLRLINEGEKGNYILKPVPSTGKNRDQMPANEHLTMQIARQVFRIETAENALVFFKNAEPAYLTRRFDIREDETKWAKEDFASLAGRTPQTHGGHYKYAGNYLELFDLMKKHLPAYKTEAPKLFKLLAFNYLFSNGDAHFKNFSLLETPYGDFRLSPAYDLLNSRLHIDDQDFALDDGLLPRNIAQGNFREQFHLLAGLADIGTKLEEAIIAGLLSNQEKVVAFVAASFLNDRLKQSYLQAYQSRYKKLNRK